MGVKTLLFFSCGPLEMNLEATHPVLTVIPRCRKQGCQCLLLPTWEWLPPATYSKAGRNLFCFVLEEMLLCDYICLRLRAGDQSQGLTIARRATPSAPTSCLLLMNLVHLQCSCPVRWWQTDTLFIFSLYIVPPVRSVHSEDTRRHSLPQIIAQEVVAGLGFKPWTICLHNPPS